MPAPVPDVTGSSPHSRGGPARLRDRTTGPGLIPAFAGRTLNTPWAAAGVAFRLIPAFAGRTPRTMPLAVRGWAHPRIRGEDITVRHR